MKRGWWLAGGIIVLLELPVACTSLLGFDVRFADADASQGDATAGEAGDDAAPGDAMAGAGGDGGGQAGSCFSDAADRGCHVVSAIEGGTIVFFNPSSSPDGSSATAENGTSERFAADQGGTAYWSVPLPGYDGGEIDVRFAFENAKGTSLSLTGGAPPVSVSAGTFSLIGPGGAAVGHDWNAVALTLRPPDGGAILAWADGSVIDWRDGVVEVPDAGVEVGLIDCATGSCAVSIRGLEVGYR